MPRKDNALSNGKKKKKTSYHPFNKRNNDISESSNGHAVSHTICSRSFSADSVEVNRTLQLTTTMLNESSGYKKEMTLNRFLCDDRPSMQTRTCQGESKNSFHRYSVREINEKKKCPRDASCGNNFNGLPHHSAASSNQGTEGKYLKMIKTNRDHGWKDSGNHWGASSKTETGRQYYQNKFLLSGSMYSKLKVKTSRNCHKKSKTADVRYGKGCQKYATMSSSRGVCNEYVDLCSNKPIVPQSGRMKKRSNWSTGISDATQDTSVNQTQSGRSTPSSQGMRNIPGFYYDHEQKRYFRILPGHCNTGSCVTSETIEYNKAEDKRQELMKIESLPKIKDSKSYSAVSLLRSFQQGSLSSRQYSRYATECRIRAMDVLPSTILEPLTSIYGNDEQVKVQFIQMDRSQSKLMVVLRTPTRSRILSSNIKTTVKDCKKQLEVFDWQDVYHGHRMIKSAILVNGVQPIDNPEDTHVLFSSIISLPSGGERNALEFIKFSTEQHDSTELMRYGDVHCITWSKNPRFPSHMCIGYDRDAQIKSIGPFSVQQLDTNKTEVYSQEFAKEQPVLYLGLRNGDILCFDLRTCGPRPSVQVSLSPQHYFHNGGSVCSLNLLTEKDLLLAACTTGTIKLWDLRNRKVVREMFGHNNQYKNLPVKIDNFERIAYSVGQDKHTRLWSINDGSHLKTIPSPVPIKGLHSGAYASPAVFSMDWCGRGIPGMLIGVNSKLYWYPM